jgi:hypothetical protein
VLVSKLKEDDSIIFSNQEELTVSQAKNRYPKKPQIPTEHGIFDGVYKIVSIDFDSFPPVFTLELDGFQFKSKAELAEEDIDKLADNLKKCLKSGNDFEVSLQVFITYNKRNLKSASITAIGEKRQNAKNLIDLINIWES